MNNFMNYIHIGSWIHLHGKNIIKIDTNFNNLMYFSYIHNISSNLIMS